MEITKIKNELPHGAIKVIAGKTGYSTSTICQILKGNKSPKRATVLTTAAEYLTEYKTKELEAMQALSEAMNPESPGHFAAPLNRQSEKFSENQVV